MSNKCKETINDFEDIFIKENKGTIRIPRPFDLKIALLLAVVFSKSQRRVFECGHICFVWLQVFISIISPCIHSRKFLEIQALNVWPYISVVLTKTGVTTDSDVQQRS